LNSALLGAGVAREPIDGWNSYLMSLNQIAVGQRLGVHHQTVERCVERAVAYGPLAALDDRPRPGKEPTITLEAKAWLVSLACDKAKEHGYPHELWTTRLLARHARENAPAAGHMSGQLGPGHGVQDSWPRGNQAAQGTVLSGTARPLILTFDSPAPSWATPPAGYRQLLVLAV
jgi:hypothetical protein